MNKSVARGIIILLVMMQFISVIIPQMLNISSVKAQASLTIRAIDSSTGLNHTALGNASEPFPAGGLQFTLNFTLTGETSDLLSWNIGVKFDNDSVRCTRALVPEGDPSYVFYGKQGIAVFDLSGQDTLLREVWVGGGLLNPADSVTVNNALLCILNFTVLNVGDFNISFVSSDTFILDSNNLMIPSDTSGFKCSGVGIGTSGTIYIRADGSIDPPTAPIHTADNITYTLTGNIAADADGIVIKKNNTIIDGNGYTLQGTGRGNGTDLTGRSNVTIKNMKIEAFECGVNLHYSSNNSVVENKITNNTYYGIKLEYSSNNSMVGNNITNNVAGIRLYWYSEYNSVVGNNIKASAYYGLELSWSGSNDISANNIVDGNEGISLENGRGSKNTLRSNRMSNNTFNFRLEGYYLSELINDVDISNTVDDKPIYYWVNKQDLAVPVDAGYVALINCSHITVQNLTLTKNHEGILFAFTNNSIIVNNNITQNYYGILLEGSSNSSISGNNIVANCQAGIYLSYSDDNKISENNLSANYYTSLVSFNIYLGLSSHNEIFKNNITANKFLGIQLVQASNNSIFENKITENGWAGIELEYSSNNNTICENRIEKNSPGIYINEASNNTVFHNSIVNNHGQVHFYLSNYSNIWDNGVEGNYWSDYTGIDANHDGIGDTAYIIDVNNTDRYPLMGMFIDFNATSDYLIQTICNSTISDFQFNGTSMIFDVSGENGTVGFCRICIPKALMNASYKVYFNGTQVSHNLLPCSNETYSYLYFNYTHSTQEVIIIPEFPSILILPLFFIATLLAVIVYRRKHPQNE